MQFVGSNRQIEFKRDYIKKKEEGSEMLINKVLKESENRLKARTIKRVLKKNSPKLEQVKSVSSISIKKI